MGFSRQEYWSRRLCPSSRDLPKPGNKSESLKSSALAGGFFTTSTTWDLPNYHYSIAICQHPYSQSYGFSSSHVWMCELDHKESWASKKWCFWTLALGKTLESPLDFKKIKSVNRKGNQSWTFLGSTNAEAKASIFFPLDAKNWLTGKRPWYWERLKPGGEGDNRRWDDWMITPTQWTWIWASFRSW